MSHMSSPLPPAPLPADHFERRLSQVHGLGVFTRRPIAMGAAVFEFGGPTIPASQVRDGMRVMQVGTDEYIVEDVAADHIENYINHRCEPNLGFLHGSLTLVALRDIDAGEELFWDYSTSINEPGWRVACRCGASACRGSIASFCDLDAEVRVRLSAIALRYLRM